MRLMGKNVLVTGSGRGFGQSLAVAYAGEGAHVVSVARTVSELRDTEKMIDDAGGRVTTFPCDLSCDDSLMELVELVTGLGGVDVLVNNAATSPWVTIDKMTRELWDNTIDVNLRAPFLLSLYLYRQMADRGGGSIINISSGSAEKGFMAELAYCSGKFGLEGLTQCLTLELKNYNISVNSLNVGAPRGYGLKPTELTRVEAEHMPIEVKSRYAPVDLMVKRFRDAWVFLALQKGDGVTGQRFNTNDLAREIEEEGVMAVVERYSGKLLKAEYKMIDFPEKVRFQSPDGGWRVTRFT